jgi:hypothetical protein
MATAIATNPDSDSLVMPREAPDQASKSTTTLRELFHGMQRRCEAGSRWYMAQSQLPAGTPPTLNASGEIDHTAPSPSAEPIGYFHSRCIPKLTLGQFAAAILRSRAHLDEQSLLVGLVLMVRYTETSGVRLTLHLMHRLYVACVMVGAKTHQDVFPCNILLARVVGMQIAEVNRLEVALLTGVAWTLVVRARHVDHLVAFCRLEEPTTVVTKQAPTRAPRHADPSGQEKELGIPTPVASPHPAQPARPCDASTASWCERSFNNSTTSPTGTPPQRRGGNESVTSHPCQTDECSSISSEDSDRD